MEVSPNLNPEKGLSSNWEGPTSLWRWRKQLSGGQCYNLQGLRKRPPGAPERLSWVLTWSDLRCAVKGRACDVCQCVKPVSQDALCCRKRYPCCWTKVYQVGVVTFQIPGSGSLPSLSLSHEIVPRAEIPNCGPRDNSSRITWVGLPNRGSLFCQFRLWRYYCMLANVG